MSDKISQTISKENILSDEFLNYFCSSKYVYNEIILTKFLNQMINITEVLFDDEIEKIKPITILKNLVNKNYANTNFLNAINKVAVSNKIETFSLLELFTMLWWFSCKNIFIFEQSYYYLQAKNGNIGKILIQLNKYIINKT